MHFVTKILNYIHSLLQQHAYIFKVVVLKYFRRSSEAQTHLRLGCCSAALMNQVESIGDRFRVFKHKAAALNWRKKLSDWLIRDLRMHVFFHTWGLFVAKGEKMETSEIIFVTC